MGRRRTNSPSWLPKRCYPHRDQIRYIPPTGKPIVLGPLDNPAACLRRYGEIIGRPSLDAGKTLGAAIDRYLLEVVPTLAPRSQIDYRAMCGNLKAAFGHMDCDAIKVTHLYEYHEKRGAPVRANREICILRKIYRYAIKWRMATTTPYVHGFIYAEEKPRDRNVTGSERRRFARQCCPDWLRGYLALKYLTGRRQGELLKLGRFSERPNGLVFKILKKRRERELIVLWSPRLRAVWEWLKALPRPMASTMIFTSSCGPRRGQGLTQAGFKTAWQTAQGKWRALGGQAFWEHDIRAAAATASKSDAAAQVLLDHTSAAITRRYRRGVGKVMPLR